MDFIIALSGIIMVNIVLSGDNAVVIALASRCLPPQQQKLAILWGSAGAIVLRVILTIAAVALLQIPYLQFIGGILLVWIAAKLLLEEEHGKELDASDSLWTAVKTIIIADIVMSLDNTLAIAAIAKGDYALLVIGLGLSMPLIIFGSQLLVALMSKFPLIVYAGSGLIAWTAGEMVVHDSELGHYSTSFTPEWVVPMVITVAVLAYGLRQKKFQKEEEALDKEKGSQ